MKEVIKMTKENGSNVGKIMVSEWGYDQTNIDFYVVVRETKASVWIAPIAFGSYESVGYDEHNVTASKKQAQQIVEQYQKDSKSVQGVEMHRKMKNSDELACWVSSFAIATEYHGEELLETSYY